MYVYTRQVYTTLFGVHFLDGMQLTVYHRHSSDIRHHADPIQGILDSHFAELENRFGIQIPRGTQMVAVPDYIPVCIMC